MQSLLRLRRLILLIEILQSGRIHNSQQLADLMKVSRRTVFRDLEVLHDVGLHVLIDEVRQGYYLPTRITLPRGSLSVDEAISLLLVCNSLGDDKGVPFQQHAISAARKVLEGFPRQMRDRLGEIAETVSIRIDSKNPLDTSHVYFQQLTQAILERRHVRIGYSSLAEQKSITTLLSPYRVLFSRRSWYVIGRSSIHRAVRTFNLGRVCSATTLDSTYSIPPRFSLARYLGNAWHLIREPGQDREVVILFSPKVATNVAEVEWHPTQKLTWRDDGSLEFRATVSGLNEISWWILGYGSLATVLQPAGLREMIRNHAAEMLASYDNG